MPKYSYSINTPPYAEEVKNSLPEAVPTYQKLWSDRTDSLFVEKFFIPDDYNISTDLFREQLLSLKSLQVLDFSENLFGFKINIFPSKTTTQEGSA